MQILLLADLVDIDWILFSHKLWSQNKPYLERNWAHSSCGQIYLHSTAAPRFVFALRGLPRICASQSAVIPISQPQWNPGDGTEGPPTLPLHAS